MKPSKKDIQLMLYRRRHGNSTSQTIRQVCNGIKLRIRKEKDPEKKAMWAIIGLELNNLLLELE